MSSDKATAHPKEGNLITQDSYGPGSPREAPLTHADDSNLPRGGVVRPHKDTGYQQEGVIRVELGELSVAPVVWPHVGAVLQGDVQLIAPDLQRDGTVRKLLRRLRVVLLYLFCQYSPGHEKQTVSKTPFNCLLLTTSLSIPLTENGEGPNGELLLHWPEEVFRQ